MIASLILARRVSSPSSGASAALSWSGDKSEGGDPMPGTEHLFRSSTGVIKAPEPNMTFRLTGAIAILAMVALPALAQTQTSPSSQNSGAGIAGQPGGKNGPAPKSTASNDQNNPTTQLQDTSKIQGKPGSKSGPAVNPPSKQ